MATRQEWLDASLERRLERLARAPTDLATAIHDQSDATLSRRPDGRNWCAKEIVCHLRDIEELAILRFHTILAMDDPKVLAVGAPLADPLAWASAATCRSRSTPTAGPRSGNTCATTPGWR